MAKWSRRKLLAGLGTTVGIQTAGCLSTPEQNDSGTSETRVIDPSETEEPDRTADKRDIGFETLLTYLPGADEIDHPSIYATDVTAMNNLNRPLDSFASAFYLSALKEYTGQVTKAVGFSGQHYVSVFDGEVSLSAHGHETRETAAGETYELYDPTFHVVAIRDGVSIVADSETALEAAFAAKRGDEPRYIDQHSITTVVPETLPDADLVTGVQPADGFFENSENRVFQNTALTGTDVSRFLSAVTVEGPDTLEGRFQMTFTDSELITTEYVDSVAEIATSLEPYTDAKSVTVDGNSIIVRETVDLAAQRVAEGLESPQLDERTTIRSEFVEITVIAPQNQFPVENLTLRVAGEEYEQAIWTQGKETITNGDTIFVATEDIAPLEEITLVHEHDHGFSSSRLSVTDFNFEMSHDPEAERATITYQEPLSLDGDRLYLAIYDVDWGDYETKVRSRQPWKGETLTAGDEGLVEDYYGTDAILVCWDEDKPENRIYAEKALEGD